MITNATHNLTNAEAHHNASTIMRSAKLNWVGYSGDSWTERADLSETRQRAARMLRLARKRGACVVKLGPEYGTHAYEICEPEGCMMVPDYCGVLRLSVAIANA